MDFSCVTQINATTTRTDTCGAGLRRCFEKVIKSGIRAIDYGIQLISINLQIISNIPQFFHYGRIPLGINITMILTGSAVIKIKRTLITSHISFIEKIHSFNTDAP